MVRDNAIDRFIRLRGYENKEDVEMALRSVFKCMRETIINCDKFVLPYIGDFRTKGGLALKYLRRDHEKGSVSDEEYDLRSKLIAYNFFIETGEKRMLPRYKYDTLAVMKRCFGDVWRRYLEVYGLVENEKGMSGRPGKGVSNE